MVNERKTENIVRDSLRKLGYYDNPDIIIEEQSSKNPRIKKLLKNASKKGTGQGYPEFIIRSRQISDLIILIECKADVKKHGSKGLDSYADYAVDGALYYASHLSMGFNVFAIGISGENPKKAKISNYLFLNKSGEYEKILGDKILSFDDYYNYYINNPKKFNQEYEKLLDYSKKINKLLHTKKVKESQRSLLISGILIALKNRAFADSFMLHKTAKQLSKSLVEYIGDELSNSDIPDDKCEDIKQAFSFIQRHTTLSKDKEFLQNLIQDIDDNINSFMKTYKFFDTVGQFYIEFLRYANNDKGLGIVLTPPHITELFCELGEINKDSIILDNCCGTSGFLISAMKHMVKDAKGDSGEIEKIKSEHIVGIEYQDDIYALSISNMIIHGDGKSNIHQGDCFDIYKEIKEKYHPTVGFLNPPYKTHTDDSEELEFVLNNLEMLEQNGKCVAIIPISCVSADSGKPLLLKQELMEHHTLDAVMSMPSEIFHNSKVNVITAIVVITAHKPHPSGKKTWFGYWRDDGFIKTKHKGRIDGGDWHKIKNEWIQNYRNKIQIPEKSIFKEVKPEDEWCAEAYMKANYKEIDRECIKNELKKYIIHDILNEVE